MALIRLSTTVDAPLQRVFDLSRSIDAHRYSAEKTSEIAVAGRISGLINLGEEVEWEARHLGLRLRLKVRITKFEYPYHFQDVMIKGAFSSMQHDHMFKEIGGKTVVEDHFEYRAPFGWIGLIVERLFLTKYMTNFLLIRNKNLKRMAETEEWKRFLVV